MNSKYILFLISILITLVSCNKKEELYEVEIPENPLIIEDSNQVSLKNIIVKEGSFKMKGLNFEYNELEPFLDSKTVEIHYSKYHLEHIEKLNELIKGTSLESKSIEEIISSLTPENKELINNAGGFYNHNLYWEILGTKKSEIPTGKIAQLINRDFSSYESFKSQFKKAGIDFIGSGWVWLILTEEQNLKIVTSTNQNNPLMTFESHNGYPLMNLDLWEHAYYLKYKNNKADYIDNFFKMIDWEKVNYRINLYTK